MAAAVPVASRPVLETLLALGLGVIAVGFLLRGPVLSGFEQVSADDLDGVLQLALLEHWRNVLAGEVAWHTPNFFHPIDGVLGYNDGYLLFGLAHAGFRALGFDAIVAQELVHISFRVLGFLGVWLAMRRCFGASLWMAAFAATLATVANVVSITLGHSQLALSALTPFAFVLGRGALSGLRRGEPWRFGAYLVTLAVLFGFWLLSGFYMPWMTVIVILAVALVLFFRDRAVFSDAFAPLLRRDMRWPLVAGIASAMPFLAAFLSVYLPKLRETGGHSFGSVIDHLPTFPRDLINVGADNLLWSPVLAPVYPLLTSGEAKLQTHILHSTAFTPVVSLCFIVAAVTISRWTRDFLPGTAALLRAVAVALPVLYLAQMRIGDVTPWYVIAKLVPGGSGVRVVTRMNLVLLVVAAMFLALWLGRCVAWRSYVLAAILGVVMLLEQTSTLDLRRAHSSSVTAFLDSTPKPPETCAAFYAINSTPESLFWPGRTHNEGVFRWVVVDIAAMLVATESGVPTLNGHASFLPEGWKLKGAADPDYRDRVRDYARRYNLESICSYDLKAHAWGPAGFN